MIHTRKWLTVAALATVLSVTAAGAADFAEKRFYVAPMLGWTFFDNDRLFQSGQPLNDDVYFGGRAGVRLTNILWFDLAAGYTGTKDCADCTESWTHYSGNLMLSRASSNTFNPFISLGAGLSRSKHAVDATESAASFEAALGLRVRMNDALGIRLEARNVLTRDDAGWSKSHIDDVIVAAGLTLGFGDVSSRSDTDDSRVVGQAEYDGDADHDGVRDSKDNCPNSPRDCKVDEHGCTLDEDGDGICDTLDRCLHTPPNTYVDVHGCPVVVNASRLETELLDTGKIQISNVNFDFDKSDIRPDAYAVLDTVGRVLTKWPGLDIQIDAYTDSRGTEAYNYDLSPPYSRCLALRS